MKTVPPRRTACITSTGCISNLLDGTTYEQLLGRAGYEMVTDLERADLILINSCAFNLLKEEESVGILRQAQQHGRPGARIVVCGCMPGINRERLNQLHSGVTFGPRDPSALLEMLQIPATEPLADDGPISFYQYAPLKRLIYRAKNVVEDVPGLRDLGLVRRLLSPLFIYRRGLFCLRIENGCAGTCSYCAIRFAKGRTRSRPMAAIQAEWQRALAEGHQEFVLVGDEITSYGSDLGDGLTVLDVMEPMLRSDRVRRLYLESFEPSFMIARFEELATALATGKIPVFCSSAQSGSDRVLAKMRRLYQVEEYRRCMKEIRRRFPWIYLRSEIIVGFPGETAEDLDATLRLIQDLNLDFVDVYVYEDRPNTLASRMPGKITDRECRVRRKRVMRRHWRNVLLRPH